MKEYKNEENEIVCSINQKRRSGTYFVRGKTQREFVEKIALDGFTAFPIGFRKSGAGLTGAGFFLLRNLSTKYKRKLQVRVSKTRKSRVSKGRSVTVTINHDDLRDLNKIASSLRTRFNNDVDRESQKAIAMWFPREFKAPPMSTYSPGSIAKQLESKSAFKRLSDEDIQALAKLYPQVAEKLSFTSRTLTGTQLVAENIKQSQKIQLTRVRDEFSKMLKQNLPESSWQEFLRAHILLFLRSYAAVIEKQNVSIAPRFPDFLLVDPYGYADIFEIKRPQTKLVVEDKSHKNYYWAPDMAKAIAQVENYIDAVGANRLAIRDHLKKEGHGEVQLLRPRGFIIAGRRSDLDDPMQDDARVIASGLSNIDIIYYDDLLNNLNLLLDRLGGIGNRKSRRRKPTLRRKKAKTTAKKKKRHRARTR